MTQTGRKETFNGVEYKETSLHSCLIVRHWHPSSKGKRPLVKEVGFWKLLKSRQRPYTPTLLYGSVHKSQPRRSTGNPPTSGPSSNDDATLILSVVSSVLTPRLGRRRWRRHIITHSMNWLDPEAKLWTFFYDSSVPTTRLVDSGFSDLVELSLRHCMRNHEILYSREEENRQKLRHTPKKKVDPFTRRWGKRRKDKDYV